MLPQSGAFKILFRHDLWDITGKKKKKFKLELKDVQNVLLPSVNETMIIKKHLLMEAHFFIVHISTSTSFTTAIYFL